MSLSSCEECGGRVSTAANACPHCGRPFRPVGLRGLALWTGALIFTLGLLTATGIAHLRPQDCPPTSEDRGIPDAKAGTQTRPSSQLFYVITGAANIRSGPSLDDRIVAVVSRGDQLQTMSAQEDWLEVTVMETGRVGWIHTSTVGTGPQSP
jgi:uncharacterized protein YgiM (DUF1202 family)